MKKNKVLWISCSAPVSSLPYAGHQTYNYYFKNISKDDRFEVSLIAYERTADEVEAESEVTNIHHKIFYWKRKDKYSLKNIVNLESKYNLLNRNANLISNYFEKKVLNCSNKWKKSGYYPDVIILEWTASVVLARKIHLIFPNSRLIASEHDVTFIGYCRNSKYYQGVKGFIWTIKAWNEKKIELESLNKCSLIMPHNADNALILKKEGLDNKMIQWLPPFYHNMGCCNRNSNCRDILFFGAMSREENYLSAIWFIENVMPKLNNTDFRFVIMGSHPPEILKKYQNEKIILTGYVDSILHYFETSMCFVAPLVLGAGIKVKVLEALSAGIPVLTNNIGIEGIPARDGKEYYHCESAEDYADRIINLNGEKNDLGLNAKKFIEEHFSLERAKKMYIQSILDLSKIN